jgi:hypothetical protein
MKTNVILPQWRWLMLAVAILASRALAADYTGKVLTPDGKPVKGATVYLDRFANESPSPTTRPDLPTTRTDEAGVFHFPRTAPNGVEFIAGADGFGISSAELKGDAPIEIHLRPRTDLTLTFRTADGNAAANVSISLRRIHMPIQVFSASNGSLWIPPQYRSPWSAATDANGICTLAGLPQGGYAMIEINDERYARLSNNDSIQLSLVPQSNHAPIRLQLAASISGKITYGPTSQPAAAVRVRAESDDRVTSEALTAADGSYAIKRLSPGQYNISLDLGDELQKSWTANAVQKLAVAPGEDKTKIDLALIPGVVLSGKVLAADDARPVPGVLLGIYGPARPRSDGFENGVTTDANGAFTIHVPPGEQTVDILSETPADGFARPTDDERKVAIPPGGVASVEFRLPRAIMSPIKGTVLDPDGKPVANASVFAYSEQSTFLSTGNAIPTNADGAFQTPPVMRSVKVEVRAKFRDLATPRSVVVNRDLSGQVVIHLQRNSLASITGRVIDSQGQPLKDAQIELIYPMGRYRFGNNAAGATDDRGAYKIDSLWADLTYMVEADHDGYSDAESSNNLRVVAGQSTRIPDLKLYKRDSTIAGVLLDRDNKPVAGQRMFVRGPRTGFSNFTTDSNGKFQSAVVSNDRLTIYYNVNTALRQRQQSVHFGDQNIVLHTAPPAVAAPPVASPAPVVSVAPQQPITATPVYDPADAVTWNGWVYAVILVLGGGVITIVLNAIAAIRGHKSAA